MKHYIIVVSFLFTAFFYACSSGDDSIKEELELTTEQKEFISVFTANYPTQTVSFNTNTAISGAPFVENQKITLTFSSSGMLFIDTDPDKNDGDEIELPVFTINGDEYVWEDAENDLSYALSLKADNFINKINVLRTSTNLLYASLKEVIVGGNNGGDKTDSYYFFGDDNIECTPISQGKPLVSTVHIISNPCQSNSAALTFYFDLMKVINAGTYNVLASEGINVVPGVGKLTMVFYSHDSKNWFAQSGTVEVTVNAIDSSEIDLKFEGIVMKAEDGTETTFTGQIIGV